MSSDGHLSRLHATYDSERTKLHCCCVISAPCSPINTDKKQLLAFLGVLLVQLFPCLHLRRCLHPFFSPPSFFVAPSFLTLTPVPSSARPGIIKSENPNIQPPFPGSIVTLLVALNKCLCNIACSDQFRAAPWMLSQFAPVLLLTT